MAKTPPLWLGARKLTLKPEGIDFDYTDRVSATLSFHGPYELCLAERPARGAAMPGFGGLVVDRAVVRRGSAPGFGELVVYLSDDNEDGSEQTGQPVTEIFWLEVERDLLTHPRYTTGPLAIGAQDRQRLALWREQTDPVKRASLQWERLNSTGAVVASGTLSGGAAEAAGKIDLGRDSWVEYTPVAVLVTYGRQKPSTVRACGKRIAGKPFAACPDGYVWLRTADRHARSGRHGKWQRTQQFTGAAEWDSDLYGAES